MTIHQMAERFNSLNFDQVVHDSIEATKGTIALFDRENLRFGFKVDGSRIGQYKSAPYAVKKYLQSPLAGRGYIDLYLTGSWSDGISVIVNSKSFSTFSDDSKAATLESRYGKLIYGLPTSYGAKYTSVLFPVVFGKVKAATVGG